MLIIFTNLTFYKNRNSHAKLVLITVIIISILMIYLQTLLMIKRTPLIHYLRYAIQIPYHFLVFNWLGFSSLQAYKRIKNQDIEPWIKARYKLVFIFSFIMSLSSITQFFRPYDIAFGDPTNVISLILFGITSIIAITCGIGFTLAWVMPNWLKRYLNRNYQPLEEKVFSEEELMNLIRKELSSKNKIA